MNFLGLGPGELLVVMVLALIVFGPQRLPEIGRGLGKAIGEFRRATSAITQEFNRELQLDSILNPSAEQATPPQETQVTKAAVESSSPSVTTAVEEPPSSEPSIGDTTPARPVGESDRAASKRSEPSIGDTAPARPVGESDRAASKRSEPSIGDTAPAPEAAFNTEAGEATNLQREETVVPSPTEDLATAATTEEPPVVETETEEVRDKKQETSSGDG